VATAVPPGRPSRGLRGAVEALGGAVLELLHTRLELASVELDEVRDRAIERLILVLIAMLALGFAVLGASALVVVAFWDTYRIAALCGITLAYLLIGLLALWRLSTRQRAEGAPFAGTLAEFERDRAWLAGQWGEDK
jgi:uncharacterized membrane protein YqjE